MGKPAFPSAPHPGSGPGSGPGSQSQPHPFKLPAIPRTHRIQKRPLQKRRPPTRTLSQSAIARHRRNASLPTRLGGALPRVSTEESAMEHLDTPYGNDRDGKPTIYVSPRTSVAGLVGRVCKHLDKAAGRAAAGKVTERMQGLAIGGTAPASGATGAENGKIKASASSAADVAADTAVEAAAAAVRESEIWLVAAGRAMDKLVRAAAALLAARPDAQVAVFTGSVRATDDIIPVSTSGTSHAKRFARASSDDGRHAGNDDASWETEPEQDQSDADPNRMEIDGDGAEDEDLFGGGGAGAAAGAGDTAGFESSSRTRMVGVLEVQVRLK